jgi:hypothetical protein
LRHVGITTKLLRLRNAEQAMPPGPTLDGEARLEERERPGMVTLINAETPVALGAKRSADTVKGGIARVSQPDGMLEGSLGAKQS